MKAVVSVRDFCLTLGGKQIVQDLSFDVYKGEVFAFLGANGSGKTSTIRSLLGVYPVTSGELLINGQTYHPEMSKQLGYLPEERGLYMRAKVLDAMIYFGQLKGMSHRDAKDASLAYLQQVGLADKAAVKIRKLSAGQQQKVQLGVAIINKPQLLILDEPTKGLDPVNRKLLLDMVRDLQQKGTAVIYITHLMEEVERLADRLLIIKDGQKRAYGSVDEVKRQHGHPLVLLQFSGKLPANPKTFTIEAMDTNYAELAPTKKGAYHAVFVELADVRGLEVSRFEVAQPTIEDIFVTVYREAEKHA